MSIFFKKTAQISLALIIIISLQNTPVFGQIPSFNQPVAINLNMSPLSPRAGDNVTLELSGFSGNINSAKITWYVDGVVKKQGPGQKILTIQTKINGGGTIIRATAETADGRTGEVLKTITPNGVDIIIEPTGYLPSFYRGKPLFVNQGTMRIVAIPDVIMAGKRIGSKNLTFKWTKDDIVVSSGAGTGNDSIVVNGSVPIREININVQVLDSFGNVLAENSKIISPNDPKILLYENSPLYGVLLNKAIVGNFYLGAKEELNVIAKPYFFNIGRQDSDDINYKWSVNGASVDLSGKKNTILLKQAGNGTEGMAVVSADINNLLRIFQYTNVSFNITFGQ